LVEHDGDFDQPEFLARLRAGDAAAYRRLIRRYNGALVGIAQAVIGSRAQAEEVVQDTWLAVFRNIARFEGRSSLAGWLFTIARNRARTRITSEGRTVGLPGADGVERSVDASNFRPDGHWTELPALWDELNPERLVGGQQLWKLVQAAIETLPAAQKATILLRDIEGLASEEVCELLGVSAEYQRVLLHRARGKVRAAIDVAMGDVEAKPVQAVMRKVVARKVGGVARVMVWVCAMLRNYIATPIRHCERSAAIHAVLQDRMDCRVAPLLAKTG
jgi:RNA polymerase sigma-70 factor (ECF subfamily)